MPSMTTVGYEIRELRLEDQPQLEQMYDAFVPLGEALGLPPPSPERRRAWLERLHEGINFVAVSARHITGHLVLMPSERSAEMAVFVHQDFRRQGVATSLTRAAMEEARRRGLLSVWVMILSANTGARNGLRKFGFRSAWESMGEVQMVYSL